MSHIHRSRSFRPALSTLEGRCLLSGGVSAPQELHAPMAMHMHPASSEVTLTPEGVYNKMGQLKSIRLMAMVDSSTTGTPTGKVTLEMVMPAGMEMSGMKPGTTILGTETLHDGMATFTVKPSTVLNMPLKVIYGGSAHFKASADTPPTVTSSELASPPTDGGMGMGMKM
jgi:Bacterial Ig-like domain (group 3)